MISTMISDVKSCQTFPISSNGSDNSHGVLLDGGIVEGEEEKGKR
jgi:hypothetical protein